MELVKKIQTQIDYEAKSHEEINNKLMQKAFDAFSEVMGQENIKPKIQAMVEAVENSKDLTEEGEFYSQWARVDLTGIIDLEDTFLQSLLQRYFEENHFMGVDFKNSVVTYSIGPALIINEDGDLLDQDSGKFVIERKEYDSREELIAKINSWMEKGGYYPSVIKVDRHGNAQYINVTPPKKEVA